MLILSQRHSTADLDLWDEHHAADMAWAHTDSFRAKCVQAQNAIIGFACDGPFHCSVSWGKDSIATTHMMLSLGIDVPVIHAIPSERLLWQDRELVRDEFLLRFPCQYSEVTVDYSGLSDDACISALGNAMRKYGKRYMTGIARRESRKRKWRSERWGCTSPNTCAPLNYWTSADVFAYLAKHDLPVHPAYAMLGGGRWAREKLRVDDLTGGHGTGAGRTEWEMEYYGDVIRRIEHKNKATKVPTMDSIQEKH